MVRHGQKISVYVQNQLLYHIDFYVKTKPEMFLNRNNFINCAIVREIRRL